ncbi:MAG TPA: glycosyltransferase, partial [Gemmatimonadaceae bacterium]|nr:glycosyltransferase [Gemmatimonadaceae bacterium]
MSVVTALSVQGLRERGWEVEVIAPRYPDGDADIFGPGVSHAQVTSIPSMPLPGYRDIRLAAPARATVRTVFERFKPDIV